jgi:hypothetical protein
MGGARAGQAKGPLTVHPTNGRYFTDGSGRAVYLSGLQGGFEMVDNAWGGYFPEGATLTTDFNRYLRVLDEYELNYLRLWTLESTRWQKGNIHKLASPLPYLRTGPGKALDGEDKWDLDRFDVGDLTSPRLDSPHFFERLRARCLALHERGIYVMIVLFEGFGSVHPVGSKFANPDADPWVGHPYNAANNVNGVNADKDGDGVGIEFHSLEVPSVTARQVAYVKKVVDTVNDLDNVLYEIANESVPQSRDWQYAMIKVVKDYEATKPKQHPVLMSASWAPKLTPPIADLYGSPAEAIAPGGAKGFNYVKDPPAAPGTKVLIGDFDHIDYTSSDPSILWRLFTRGYNPVTYDWGVDLLHWHTGGRLPDDKAWVLIRRAGRDTRRYANRMDLAAMAPRSDLASTRFCLANPGVEYLVYQSEPGDFTVTLPWGSYRYEWFDTGRSEVISSGTVNATAGSSAMPFAPPPPRPIVLYLAAAR